MYNLFVIFFIQIKDNPLSIKKKISIKIQVNSCKFSKMVGKKKRKEKRQCFYRQYYCCYYMFICLVMIMFHDYSVYYVYVYIRLYSK